MSKSRDDCSVILLGLTVRLEMGGGRSPMLESEVSDGGTKDLRSSCDSLYNSKGAGMTNGTMKECRNKFGTCEDVVLDVEMARVKLEYLYVIKRTK